MRFMSGSRDGFTSARAWAAGALRESGKIVFLQNNNSMHSLLQGSSDVAY